MKAHKDELMNGRFPTCSTCEKTQEVRREAGWQAQSVPTMIPDVVLYDQENPDSQGIAEFQMQDLSEIKPVDLLVVVGTGMHVIAMQKIIQEFG